MEQNQLIEQPIGEFAELYNFRDPDTAIFKTDVGLTEDVVRKISELKGEPEWMLEFRLKALAHFFEKPMPGELLICRLQRPERIQFECIVARSSYCKLYTERHI